MGNAKNVMTKSYASCKCTHAAVAGIIEQMEQHNFIADDIGSIAIDEPSLGWRLTCIPKEVEWNPQTVPECQFSLPCAVATAAYDKKVFLDCYTPQAIARKDVRDLTARISAKEESSLPPLGARVTTKLKNGSEYCKEYVYIKGHPKNPFTEQELIDKFKMCVPYSVYELSNGAVDSLIKALLSLEKVDNVVATIILPLTPK